MKILDVDRNSPGPRRRFFKTVRPFAFVALFLSCFAFKASAADWALSGDLSAHDPSIINQDGQWWCFSTGSGISVKYSTDGLSWNQGAPLFTTELSWWRTYAPTMDPLTVWAPDVHAYNGRVWCYYAVSEFGENNSAIGLKSCTSIAQGDWRDDGLVLSSKSGTQAYNAIDPFLAIDATGHPWLAFGSWFDGIHVVALDPSTMKPTGTIYSIANRPNGIEGANIVYTNGFYYLFVSIDQCCQGVNSTYKIAYGRSTNITGPYVDKTGLAMSAGGVTVLDAGNSRWKGPGGQDVYQNGDSWVIARHAYDANNSGAPTLLISDLYWDADGWPTYSPPALPVLVSSPVSTTLAPGSQLILTASALGNGLSYQWEKDGTMIPGATSTQLSIPTLQSSDSGKYAVVVSNANGSVTSLAATVLVDVPKRGRIVNLSVRTYAGSGEKTLIGGFIIAGTSAKPILVRGIGPTLAKYAVQNWLPDPFLNLFRDSAVIENNDNWGTAPNPNEIAAANGGIIGQNTLDAKESVILDSVPARAYTAQVSDVSGGQGIALLEIYDADAAQPGTSEFDAQSKLVNVSARAQVGTGENLLIIGFVINGNVPLKIMIRGLGPSLKNFGVLDPLADPQVILFDQTSSPIARNDNWTGAPDQSEITAAGGDKAGAFTIDPHDSILILTLSPGVYTAQLSDVSGGSGIGLLEVDAL